MASIIFVPSLPGNAWLENFFPGSSAAELPVAGRRFVDYAFERAQKLGVLFTEVIDWRFSERVAADFSEITSTGYPVFYMKGTGEPPHGLDDLARFQTPLTQNIEDDLIVVWGLCLTGHLADDMRLEPLGENECAETPPGLYRRKDGRWMRIVPHGFVVRNAMAWYRMNLAVLHNPDDFTLPGYSVEKGVHLGRNVVMERGTEVKGPVLLQDNVWCARNVRLDGDVIIGKGSFVSEDAHITRTIICDNTFVGPGLELIDKIVAGPHVIDAATGAWTDIEEPGVARRIGEGGGWLRGLWRFLQGASRGRRH